MLARHRPLLLAVLVVAVLAAGAAIAMSRPDPDAPVSSGPITGDLPPGDAPVVVTPRPGMSGVRARQFDDATPSSDGRSVTIDYVTGIEPCTVLDHVDVRSGASAVTITLFEGSDPAAGDVACIEIGVLTRTVVPLDEPLDGRAIVDGAA